jgi:hypothetical protein
MSKSIAKGKYLNVFVSHRPKVCKAILKLSKLNTKSKAASNLLLMGFALFLINNIEETRPWITPNNTTMSNQVKVILKIECYKNTI